MNVKLRMTWSLILLAIAQWGISQKLWTTPLKEDLYQINWLNQSYDGTVLVGGDKAMAGLDPLTGEVKWINTDLKAVEQYTVSMIDQLPYFVAKTKNLLGKEALQVVNAIDGQPALDSKAEDISIMDYSIYDDKGAILFQIKENDRYKLVWFDLVKEGPSWSLDIDKAKGGLGGLIKGKSSFLNARPTASDNMMFVSYKKSIMAIDLASGNTSWTKDYDDDVRKVMVDDTNGKLYIGVDKYLDVLDLMSGESAFSELIKLKNKFINIKNGKNGVYVMHESGMNIYDPSAKQMKWDDPDKLGRSDQVIPTDHGFVSVSKYDGKGNIALLDNKGKKVWDKSISGSLLYVGAIDKGIFYISTNQSNVLDYKKGDKVNKDDVNIKSNPAFAYDELKNKVVIFSDKKLTTFNLTTGKAKEISKDIKLEKFKSSEDWVKLEVRDKGYFIYTSQNNAFVTRSGKVKFNNYYKPVSTKKAFGALTRVVGNVGGVHITDAIADVQRMDRMMSGSFQNASSDGAEEITTDRGLYVNEAPVFGVSSTRYLATKEAKDFVYVFMKGKKEKQLVKVNKDKGRIVNTIRMKEKSPIYILDEYEDNVIRVAKDEKIICNHTKKESSRGSKRKK